jgi:hypothetical protein
LNVAEFMDKLAHRHLDDTVFAAYRPAADMSGEQILETFLAINLESSLVTSAPGGAP